MIQKVFKFILIMLCTTIPTTVWAAPRDEIISYINRDYYCENRGETMQCISGIDPALPEEEYIRAVIDCLDVYSRYYSKEERQRTENMPALSDVEYRILSDVAVVKINGFVVGTDEKVLAAFAQIQAQGIGRLFLDLSDCEGGRLDVMMAIADEIVPAGLVYTGHFPDGAREYYSDCSKPPFDIIVLTSAKTASAAEALTAALQESESALVVGEQTFGKSAIQVLYPISDGGILKLTAGKYTTRANIDIAGVGIVPDVCMDIGTICYEAVSNSRITLQINNPMLSINDTVIPLDADGATPILHMDQTFIPIRAVVEAMGGIVHWNEAEKKIRIIKNATDIYVWQDKTEATVNTEPVQLQTKPVVIRDRTYLPLRFVAEALGASVTWLEDTEEIVIDY